MTRERAKELAPIIQAFIDGKDIQVKEDGTWMNAREPIWRDGFDYRIKPEPKTRPMTRGEIQYILSTEHCILRYKGKQPFVFAEVIEEGVTIETFIKYPSDYEYAIIDKHGNPIDGWHKFEVKVEE